jgi:hypothetical protein
VSCEGGTRSGAMVGTRSCAIRDMHGRDALLRDPALHVTKGEAPPNGKR